MNALARRIWLDFDVIDKRCAELGATNDAERAERLGTTASSLSRWRRGLMDITLDRASKIAASIGLNLADILAENPKPPSPPPPAPKPPAGPGSPKPPAGPRQGE